MSEVSDCSHDGQLVCNDAQLSYSQLVLTLMDEKLTLLLMSRKPEPTATTDNRAVLVLSTILAAYQVRKKNKKKYRLIQTSI